MSAPDQHHETTIGAAAGPLRASLRVPGDKSIGHRAAILASLCVGQSEISGLPEGADVASTLAAMRAFGARIETGRDGTTRIDGLGVGGLLEPMAPIDCGNSGTTARLVCGLAAIHNFRTTLTGDASLSRRPMERITAPLTRMGAAFETASEASLPLTVTGLAPAPPLDYRLPVASAQVKSALLLAGLNARGTSRIVEPVPTRDHGEILLERFGARIARSRLDDGACEISIEGMGGLRPQSIAIPGDSSSAAFWIVAALVVPGSDITIANVCVNPRRMGLVRALQAMGGAVDIVGERIVGGEPVGSIRARHSPLKAIDLGPQAVPDTIDEYPALFVAAALAEGTTRASGLTELRYKESDRLGAMADALRAIGVNVTNDDDGIAIVGSGGAMLAGGARVDPRGDHRVAMALAIAALAAREPVTIAGTDCIAVSYPGFLGRLRELEGQA